MQKNAIGTPMLTVPIGSEGSPERAKLEAVAAALATHQTQYIVKPAGFDFEILDGKFNADTIQAAIRKEDEAMARAILANFLNLGQGSSGGAYALGSDLSDFFLGGLQYVANVITCVFNQKIIPDLIKLNFGAQPGYPYLSASGITNKASKELAETLSTLKNASLLTWSETDEAHIREQFNLPEREEGLEMPGTTLPANQQDSNSPDKSTGAQDPNADPEPPDQEDRVLNADNSRIKLAKKNPQTLMTKGAEALADLMRTNLRFMADKLIADLSREWNRLSPAQRGSAVKNVQVGGVKRYEGQLKSSMINLAAKALTDVLRETSGFKPPKKQKFADPLAINEPYKIRDFKNLPPHVRANLEAQARILSEIQAQDLFKAVSLQYGTSLVSTDSLAVIAGDLEEAADKYIETADAASMVTSTKLISETRHYHFFEPEVLDTIESFTFTNPDPVTEICQSLVGSVFLKDDADSLRFEPPLHWNCKSYLVANEIDSGAYDDADKQGLRPSRSAQEDINLCDCDGGAVKFSDSLTKFFKTSMIEMKWTADYLEQDNPKPYMLILDKKKFPKKADAVAYAEANHYKSNQITETALEWLLKQRPESDFEPGSFKVLSMGGGVKVTQGTLTIDEPSGD